MSLVSCYHPPRRTVRDPLPEIAGFDTDIGAFIESSSVSSSLGPMAPPIINNNSVQGETFLPGQIFVFGGFALRANSLGHLEQIESYAPGHQVRFGSLNYTADVRGDLIFDGFEPQPSAPHYHDGHDLALSPNSALRPHKCPLRPLAQSRLRRPRTGGSTPPRGLLSLRRWSRILSLFSARLVTPRYRTPLRTPDLPRPCQSNPIGRRSWSSPLRTFFSTHPLATS